MQVYWVYILASKKHGTLYIGVTSDIENRIFQHKTKHYIGFTSKHNVDKLVYMEDHTYPHSAIKREKQLKKWNRSWKIRLIEESNPYWNDLSAGWYKGQDFSGY